MESGLQNTLIYLVGFPGTGKYAIAQEIVAKADVRLVDNHLINNPIFSVIGDYGWTQQRDLIFKHVARIWEVVLDALVHISTPTDSFVLTNHLQEGDEFDRRHYERIRNTAELRKATFVPVRLVLSDVEEHVRRITTPARKLRHKLISAEAPQEYASLDVLKMDHANTLTLDVTKLSAAEAADSVLAHIRQL